MPIDRPTQERMRELGKNLARAMNASEEVKGAVRRLQLEGFALSLAISAGEKDERTTMKLDLQAPKKPQSEAAFRLEGDDVSFLKSMRIDPTRSARRRR